MTAVGALRYIRRSTIKHSWAYLIGSGVALSPIHNRWLTGIVTGESGEVGFFLPAFGAALWIIGALWFVADHWRDIIGMKRIWQVEIPLLTIVAATMVSAAGSASFYEGLGPPLLILSLLSLYAASRLIGPGIFLPLAVGATAGSLGIIAHAIAVPGQTTGGYLFENNFDIATGYILMGAALYFGRYRMALIALALMAILLSGSPEGVFALAILCAAVIARRDWTHRIAYLLAPLVAIEVLWILSGHSADLHAYTVSTLRGELTAIYAPSIEMSPIGIRVQVAKDALSSLTPLGEGLNMTEFTVGTVHNVPLVIVQQLGWMGVLAAIAWLWVSLWCLIKTPWKYVWVLVLTLSVFDHYIWTQMAPLWWTVVGVSAGARESDALFRKRQQVVYGEDIADGSEEAVRPECMS